MMRVIGLFLSFFFLIFGEVVQAQSIIELSEKGGLHAAYVVPTDDYDRVDVQLIVLSGTFDDPEPSGTAHLTEHLAAFSSDATILREPRERDIHASITPVSTVYTNSGVPSDAELLLRLSRAVLDTPSVPAGFAESEIEIIRRETLLRERQIPRRWLRRIALQNLYGTLRGRANNTVDDLPKLSVEKAYQFHKEHYAPSNVTLIVSGKIEPDTAAELVARVFGDTEHSAVPDKPWLDKKPDPAHRSVEYIESNKLMRDAVQFIKFIEFEGEQSSIDMQGEFFIASDILISRLENALYFEDTRFFIDDIDMHFVRNADLELSINVQLMPDFSLDEAHSIVKETMASLLDEPISSHEIDQARKKEVTNALYAKHRPDLFLSFLNNVAADGFPPVSPSVFAEMLGNVTDRNVINFVKTIVKPSATSVILAKKVD
ncbi:Zinc protease [Pseudovibrio sp. FO-BEG1]|uniref:M16 family metallopeptidase n=1 Tax=Pseudovibrio sp. (strain FO-BEG1) TaxID=911045 RepID=UPI000238CEEE|nr:insulinase family protein [Pseudovibrio sp. FO-BEG1]AEV39220.1 Zinc protease [Pseudovibrio sp. FO-BEG1]